MYQLTSIFCLQCVFPLRIRGQYHLVTDFFFFYESRSSSCVRRNSAEDSSCLPLSCSYSQSGSFFPFFREIELSLSSRSYFLSFEADRVGRIQADFFFCRLKGVVLRVQLMWWRALRSPLVSATQLLPSSGVFLLVRRRLWAVWGSISPEHAFF